MAKKTKNGTYKIYLFVGLCVGLTTLISWATTTVQKMATDSHIVEDTTKAVGGLKKDGCDPAVEARINIAVIGVEIKNIKDDVADLRVEQRADTEAILKAIKEKP